jgi:hypothetical protein
VPRPVDLGHETRGPFVIAASHGAVQDARVRHTQRLPAGVGFGVLARGISCAQFAYHDN